MMEWPMGNEICRHEWRESETEEKLKSKSTALKSCICENDIRFIFIVSRLDAIRIVGGWHVEF